MHLPLGKLTLLAGDPGLGKSFVTLDMAARLSRGDAWPDVPLLKQEPAGIVLFNAEDDLADTIAPRLDRLGADSRRIVAVNGVITGGQPHLAVAHGAEVIGDRLRIELASAARPVRFDITITGVRRGFNDQKYFYPSYTRAQFEANERRIQGS